jgi:dTDP-4-amino-4,6-dideoxygalactose transaminase
MTNIAAAIGLEQLKRVDGFNDARRKNAALYDQLLSDCGFVTTPFVPDGFKHVYHQYTILLENTDRSALQQHMQENGVGSAVVYPFSMNEQPFYKEACEFEDLSVAEASARAVLSIPVHPALSESEVHKVADVIKSFQG